MTSWQSKLRNRSIYLEEENFKLNQQVAALSKENALLSKLVMGPPTIMIACEKIVEGAAQLVLSANNILGRR
jgi:hypothetical protein